MQQLSWTHVQQDSEVVNDPSPDSLMFLLVILNTATDCNYGNFVLVPPSLFMHQFSFKSHVTQKLIP